MNAATRTGYNGALTRRHSPFIPALLGAALLLLSLPAAAAPVSPADLQYRGYVNDFAEVIDPQWEQQLTQLITVLDQKTKAQIAVVTLGSLEGEPIEDFATRLFEVWGVGHKDDRGALLLLVIQDRKSRLEVGYGLEPIIPDGYAGSLLREMRPALRQQQYGEALYTGVLLLSERVAAEAGVKLEGSGLAPPQQRQGSKRRRNPVGSLLSLIAMLAFGIMPWWMPGMGFGYRRRRRGGLLLGGFGGFGGYDRGGAGGGFGGFGGFGGGLSGGGGASSGW